jgi:hypothetical protein
MKPNQKLSLNSEKLFDKFPLAINPQKHFYDDSDLE